MNDWKVYNQTGIIFDFEPLKKRCRSMVERVDDDVMVRCLKTEPYIYKLAVAIFVQALSDYVGISSDIYYTRSKDHYIDSSEKYLRSIDNLGFIGFPRITGDEFVNWISETPERMDNIRKVVRGYRCSESNHPRKRGDK